MTVFLLVTMIALFLFADWFAHRRGARSARVAEPALGGSTPVRLPRGVFFARSHTWLDLLSTGRAWLGVDDFVLRLLDDPRVQFLKPEGSRVRRGEPLFLLEDGERRLTVQSPIDAAVVAVNPRMAERAALPRHAPLAQSWTYELHPERPSDLKAMLLGDEASPWMRAEFQRLRDLFAGAAPGLTPAVLQDGGPPVAGAMKHVAAEVWSRFEQEFLEVR